MKHTLIIVKGEPKSFQIERIEFNDQKTLCLIKYKNSSQLFHYRAYDIIIYENPSWQWHDHVNCKIYVNKQEQHNLTEVLSFQCENETYWRLTYSNGYSREYTSKNVYVTQSCLTEKDAKSVFEYLKRIAKINELGKSEDNEGLLSSLYENINFIDESLAVAPYLDKSHNKIKKYETNSLVFPFGCNASQEKAVTAAFENQISVIQGPPGTGKTQTILNILANIIIQGQNVLIVSNNNSATANVLEKLKKDGFDFMVAPLGKKENKENFIENQPVIPKEVEEWNISSSDFSLIRKKINLSLKNLRKIFNLQEQYSALKREKKDVELELNHFKLENKIDTDISFVSDELQSKKIMNLWYKCQNYADEINSSQWFFKGTINKIKWLEILFRWKMLFGIKSAPSNITNMIMKLQSLYFVVRREEINRSISDIELELKYENSQSLISELTSSSLTYFKNFICKKYHEKGRKVLLDVKELNANVEEICEQYPIILSTTFSATTSLPNHVYDYIIMDEASQVGIETGFLALTCAKNAVIVGDTMQLPNVVTEEDKIKLDRVFEEFKVPKGFNCAKYSFLQSVCTVLPDVKQTLLREHYRCHPTIINFCNQRFYGGNLLIMTKDHEEKNVMMAVKTVPGHHARGHYNQREIDVVKNEIIPQLDDMEDIGIITPYNDQVNEFKRQIPSVEVATIHKYQGREKNTIIMSVVDDQITEFCDDSNLINVAISRAKSHFFLVVSGNRQERKGNLSELVDYIEYQNLTVSNSKICSVFDYLYSNYTNERIAYLSKHKKISQYDSENLMFSLLENILNDYPEFKRFGILCHIPVRSLIHDWSLMNEEEQKYVSHFSTHLDFLIINHVTKKPVLAIEIDGYSFHGKDKLQHQRDLKKNHILELYGIPLLRLSTNESGEREKIIKFLSEYIKR